MIGIMLVFLIFASVVFSFASGSAQELSSALISSGGEAVALMLDLAGAMAVWGGVMRVAERSGLTEKLTALLKPPLKLIFRGLDKNSPALSAIAMNMTANLLGLGNASTPLGIDAMKKLELEEKPNGVATLNMIKLAVMNCCSVEIIPATVAALRAEAGSSDPMEIFPCVILVSVCSLAAALTVAEIFGIGDRK